MRIFDEIYRKGSPLAKAGPITNCLSNGTNIEKGILGLKELTVKK